MQPDFDRELLTKIAISIVIVFIFGKYIGSVLFAILWERIFNKEKKQSTDIDALIAKKKLLMAKNNPTSSDTPKESKVRHQNATIAAYQEKFQKLSSSPKKSQSSTQEEMEQIKKILALIDALQWGTAPELVTISKKINEALESKLTQLDVLDSFKKIVYQNFLISLKSDGPPNYPQVIKALEARSVLDALVKEVSSSDPTAPIYILPKLAKVKKISVGDLKKSLVAMLCNARGDNYNAKIIKGEFTIQSFSSNELDDLKLKVLKSPDNKSFTSKHELLKLLFVESEFFSSLSPIEPPKDVHDITRAREIFNADKSTPIEQIKKNYKRLANLKHPDKIASRGIPAEFELIATENFATIRMAYDMIVKDYEAK